MCVSIRQCDCQRRQQHLRKGAGYPRRASLHAGDRDDQIGDHFYTAVVYKNVALKKMLATTRRPPRAARGRGRGSTPRWR